MSRHTYYPPLSRRQGGVLRAFWEGFQHQHGLPYVQRTGRALRAFNRGFGLRLLIWG
jgi:hypothetical protein